MQQVESAAEAAAALYGVRYLDAEFMYQPRPIGERERIVFDYTLKSRLAQLDPQDAVLFICDSQQTVDSLDHFRTFFPHLRMVAAVTNPAPWEGDTPDMPRLLDWDTPDQWQRCAMTDRWARIDFALDVGGHMSAPGCLLMPAHDAVWGDGLLAYLEYTSELYARNGLPAAVSPYTRYQHYAVPGADIPQDIIDLLNTAFGRDVLFPWKIRLDRVQAFWGKMGLMPFGMCGAVRDTAEKFVWEDDLEIDGAIRRLGYGLRCRWVSDSAVYRQALPVLDRAGLHRVIERTLHYSLNIPGRTIGASTLNFPLGALGRLRQRLDPRFAYFNAEAEAIIAACNRAITGRLARYGTSWVDWGAYRYVMRVGDPVVEVWKRGINLV